MSRRIREDKTDCNDQRPVIVYGKALDITMEKQQGKYAGEKFIHKFGPGTIRCAASWKRCVRSRRGTGPC